MVPPRTLLLATLSIGLATAAAVADTTGALAYHVKAGDTLWDISQRTGVSVHDLAARNGIANPDRIYAGQDLDIQAPSPAAQPPAPPTAPAPGVSRGEARALLVSAAQRHGVDPNLVLAVSMWESGWNESEVSPDGAVGLMQVLPATARWAGPGLLHRTVNLHSASDNADLGAALLRRYMDAFHDPRLALAAYYQGEAATRRSGIYPSSRRYVDGIMALRGRFAAGEL